jgi:hypothetical protein
MAKLKRVNLCNDRSRYIFSSLEAVLFCMESFVNLRFEMAFRRRKNSVHVGQNETVADGSQCARTVLSW